MRSFEELHPLSAKLEGKHNGEDGEKSEIRLTYKSSYSTETEVLCISLRRTIRVPDNGMTYGLPPDLGPFPIYSVNKYMNNLPEIMVAKGGVFVPIHQREAMWINFTSYHPFAVKVCVGGVNAVSGEYTVESLATNLRRKAKLDKGESIQDYVVTGLNGQQWLDGVAKLDGKVMQFVATSAGNGYSVEAQITGADRVCGIQIEIIPSVIDEGTSGKFCVKTLTGKEIVLNIDAAMTVYELKIKICQIEGIPVDQQRIIFAGRQLEDEMRLIREGIQPASLVHLVLRLCGGGHGPPPTPSTPITANSEMAIAPGGLINQTIIKDFVPTRNWDKKNSLMFNIQMLNAEVFERVVGIKPPPTPISANTYACYGYPFYKMYEELSGIVGEFPVQSLAHMDILKGEKTSRDDDDENLRFNEVSLDPSTMKGTFRSVGELEAQIRNLRIYTDF